VADYQPMTVADLAVHLSRTRSAAILEELFG
jgi:hypothetical protein